MKKILTLLTLSLSLATASTHATIQNQFLFDDPNGTFLNAATPSVGATQWSSSMNDTAEINNGFLTIGERITTNQTFLGVTGAPVNSGMQWMVLEDVTWNFVGGTAGDRYRFGFTATGGTAGDRELAAFDVIYTSSAGNGESSLAGYSEGNGTTISSFVLENNRTSQETYDFVLQLDMDSSVYEIFYQVNDSGPFNSIGTGTINTSVNAANGFSSAYVDLSPTLTSGGEFIQIGSFTYTTTNPIPEPTSAALLLGAAGLLAYRRRK